MGNKDSLVFMPALTLVIGLGILWGSSANARVDSLTLQRMIAYGECLEFQEDEDFGLFDFTVEGAGHDTRANPPRAQGSLIIEADDDYIIRNMRFDAWLRGAFQPVLDDRVIILDWVPNGAWYEVQSLWNNDRYYITFIRRAPPDEGYDPAIIFAVRLFDDCVIQVDYRYD